MNLFKFLTKRREAKIHQTVAELVPAYGAFLARTTYEDALAEIIYREAIDDCMLYSQLWRAYTLPDRIRIPAGIFLGEIAQQVVSVNEQSAFWAAISACRNLWPDR